MENYDNRYLCLCRWVKQKTKHHWKENQRIGIRLEDTIQNLAQRDKGMEKTKKMKRYVSPSEMVPHASNWNFRKP